MSILDEVRCTVLNASYEPLKVVSSKHGLIMVIQGKAIIAQEHPEHVIHSAREIWPVPTQIILKSFVKSRTTHIPAQLNQRNLFLRDGYKCQYCLRHRASLKPNEFLTRDHVFPQSKGGKDDWKNVVTACSSCNNKKADFLLEDTNLILRKIPTVPTIFEIMSRAKPRSR